MENQELKEKEYYRQAIVDLVMSIERIDILIFLNKFIKNIINKEKAGR